MKKYSANFAITAFSEVPVSGLCRIAEGKPNALRSPPLS